MALSCTVGKVAALYIANGTPGDLSEEPMQEVNLSADLTEVRPRYTVYEITDAGKRNLDDSVAPVFKYSDGGTAAYDTLTPARVEYPDCRIYLSTALGSADVVQCFSGKYIAPTSVSGVENISFSAGWDSEKVMFLRDTAKRTILKQKEWSGQAETCMVMTCAELTTAMTGDNNDIVFTHTAGGTAGNAIKITIAEPSGSTIVIVVSGAEITITPGTASTAKQVVEAFNKNGQVQDLNVRADLKSGETGAGTLVAMEQTSLAGGSNPTDWTEITGSSGTTTAIVEFYADHDNDLRWVDYCQIPKSSIKISGDGINKVSLSFESRGGPNCGPFLRKQ